MLSRRRSIPDKRVFGIKTDRTNKGNCQAKSESGEWRQRQSWSTLRSRIYELIQCLHPRRLMILFAYAIGLIKRIAMVVVYGRRCRRTRLLTWFSNQLRQGGGCAAAQWAALEPCDLRVVWRKGSLLCALVDALAPGACPEHPENNFAIAQEAITRQWALPPAFTDDELLQVTFSSHFERRLLRYLSAIQQASERLPGTNGGPTPDSANLSGGLRASGGNTSPACVARGMGLFTATQFRRASFLIYLLDADPSDVFVVIQTQRDFGFARVGHQGCVLPNRYSNIPIMISQDTGNGTRVTFTPQSYGQHELVILRKGIHIPGSPFCIPVEKTNDLESIDKENVQTPVCRKKLRVLLRTVDFITEKMILTEDGKLKKLPQSFLSEHLKAIEGKSRSKPEIYIYVSEEGSTMHQVWGSSPGCSDVDSEQEGGSKITRYTPARHLVSDLTKVEPRHYSLSRPKCLHRQSNLDSAAKRGNQFHGISTRPIKGTEFQSRCKKIISMCKFVLDKSRKHHGLRLLSAVRQLVDGRPIRMNDEIELMLTKLTESIQPMGLEPLPDCRSNALELAKGDEVLERDKDRSLSPSSLNGPSDVAVHTQIKCFEDKLAYCNEYIESVLRKNTAILNNTEELKPPHHDINTDVQKYFKSALLDASIEQQPIVMELSRPCTTGLFLLDSISSQSQRESDLPTNSLEVKSTSPPVEIEIGELSLRSEINLAGFWPASSSSPSSMSEASTEQAAAIFPDLDAFLSGQFTKYMASESQFHLWPSDIAFGDVQDTICAMEDDEMVDFDSVISAPNLEEALVKLEQGLKLKSTAKRDYSENSYAIAGNCREVGKKYGKTESVDKEEWENEEISSSHIRTTGDSQKVDSNVCQDEEDVEQNCLQNGSPGNFEFVVNPPDQEADPGENLDPEELDEVSSNPSPLAGHPSVEGWDSAYLSIDDLKGSPENRLANNSITGSHCIGNGSREKEWTCWSNNGNMAITGFMGPAEKEIWGFDEEQNDDNEPANEALFYPRVLTPLTKMMSLILEEDEEKMITCAAEDTDDTADKCTFGAHQRDTNLIGVRNLGMQNNELVTEMRTMNDPATHPTFSADLDDDFHGNKSLDIHTDHNFEDPSHRNINSNFGSNLDGLLSDNLDSVLDATLGDTLDEDVSVAFDTLIAEQLDLFEVGSEFDSALAEALQVSALQDNIALPTQDSVELSVHQDTMVLSEQKMSRLDGHPQVIEFSVLQKNELLLQKESVSLPVQQNDGLPEMQENTSLMEQKESEGLPIQNASIGLPVQKKIAVCPISQDIAKLSVQNSKKLTAQEFRVAIETELPEQYISAELSELGIEMTVVKYCTVCDQTEVEKCNNRNFCCAEKIEKDVGEGVIEEPDRCNYKMDTNDGFLQAATLAVDEMAIFQCPITTRNELISDVITLEEYAYDSSSKSHEKSIESDSTTTDEQVATGSFVKEIIDEPKEEIGQISIDIPGDANADNDLVQQNNACVPLTNLHPKDYISERFTSKDYVRFKKVYWDRKVQLLDLVSKHSQPRSEETAHDSIKKPTSAAPHQIKDFNLPLSSSESGLIFATGQPAASIKSKMSPETPVVLRSPSLYRARRVLVSEDSNDDLIPKHSITKKNCRPQDEDKDVQKEYIIAQDSKQIKEVGEKTTKCLPRGTRQCKEAEIDIQVECPPRRLTPISNAGMQTKSAARTSRLRDSAEDIETSTGQHDDTDDDVHGDIFCRRDSRLRRDDPEEMKARFQTAKQFFQSLEKNHSKLNRGFSTESDIGSQWKTAAGWRGPLGGSERVRVPRRCDIRDLF